MGDDAIFASTDEGLSPNSGIQITMEEGPEDNEGEEDFEIENNDLGNEDNQILQVKSNTLDNAFQQVLEIERVDIENGSRQVLGFDGEDLKIDPGHVVEFASNCCENNGEEILEIPSNGKDVNVYKMLGTSANDDENATDVDTAVTGGRTDDSQAISYLQPVEGMEFESYDDAYNYYNCYAKELGFGIRVKSSWTKRNSKEKRGAVLCCNSEGFKTMKEASSRRKETRTGCLAMIRLRLVDSNRWRLDEVKLEHNHLFDHQQAQNSRSHKKREAGDKRKYEPCVDVEVRTIKLYRKPAEDAVSYGSSNEREANDLVGPMNLLKFGNADILAVQKYFCQAQLLDPNFFYIMDLNDEGYVRNVFWIDSRSRAAYGYFGDVVFVDATCLSKKHTIPFLSFSGLNHHGRSILLGCGLIVDETIETYLWLMRAWLTCMSGRPPQTIITGQSVALRCAISEVFPRAHHCFCPHLVVQSIYAKLGEVGQSEMFQTILNRTVYNSMKVEQFEMVWEEMIQHFAIQGHEWLQSLYEDRQRWVPVYMKDTVFTGIFTFQPGKYMNQFFEGHLHGQMTWTEFFNTYELLQDKKIQEEALDDVESRRFNPIMRTRCNYESQASELYTKNIFLKFQEEVVMMSCCSSITQVHANWPVITYMVNELEGDAREAKNFEVVYDNVGLEVRCSCCCFNFQGYLCRHSLSVLSHNGLDEIPNQYILTRWRKDIKRLYAPDIRSNHIDISNPVQWFDHLHRFAMQVVAAGVASQDHHMVALQAFKESLDKVHLAVEKPV